MVTLLIGIVVFLGVHTLTTLREPRAALIGRLGEGPYKGLFSLGALVGFVLIVWGFYVYRSESWFQIWVSRSVRERLAVCAMNWLPVGAPAGRASMPLTGVLPATGFGAGAGWAPRTM